MFYEQLSENDIFIIEDMRKMADEGYHNVTGSWVNTESFLTYWEKAKGQYMRKVFKDQLILRRKVEVTVEDDELHDRMDRLVWSNEFGQMKDSIIQMLGDNQDIYAPLNFLNFNSILRNLRNYVFTVDAFIGNKYTGETLELKMPDGTMFKLAKGAKLMKALGRLAKAAGITELFESIRLQQSQIMNQAHLTTELCVSIHPLDYMTASYNANDWRSCMCWEDGEYRRGVVEMMNSPYVVVAYTPSTHEKLHFYNSHTHENVYWNSKKWREFFIVDPEIGIFAIKGYPYWNRNLEDVTLKWLAELFSEDFDKTLSPDITEWETDSYINIQFAGQIPNKVRISMHCGPAMYNDFYGGNMYHAIFSSKLEDSYLQIDYSGASECVVCGGSMYGEDFDCEGDLICNDCIPHQYCAVCGERLYDDDYAVEFEGRWYCEHCYDNLPVCDVCQSVFDEEADPSSGIHFVLSVDDTDNSEVLLEDGRGWEMPTVRNVCCDCAKDVFVDSNEEIDRNHRYRCLRWSDYYPQIPYNHLTKKGLARLYDSRALDRFVLENNLESA